MISAGKQQQTAPPPVGRHGSHVLLSYCHEPAKSDIYDSNYELVTALCLQVIEDSLVKPNAIIANGMMSASLLFSGFTKTPRNNFKFTSICRQSTRHISAIIAIGIERQ